MSDKVIMVHVPESIKDYTLHLAAFFDGMIIKLDKNSHKETPTKANVPQIMDLLAEEIAEFEEQFHRDKYGENSFVELMDVANFAFLAFVALRMQRIKHAQENKD